MKTWKLAIAAIMVAGPCAGQTPPTQNAVSPAGAVYLVDPVTRLPIPAGGSGTSTITQTRPTLAAGTSATLIAANTSRKSLRWMNTGVNPMTCVPGVGPAVAGIGMNYDPGSSTINQGGATSFDGGPVPTNAFTCISTGGTSVTVWEGN